EGGWRNVIVSDCYLAYSGHYYQGGPGPSPYDRPDGFGIEPSRGPVEIARTLVEHNRGDGIDSKAENTYVQECIVANNFADGVKLWGPGSRIENTLIYGRGDGSAETTPWAPIVIDSERPGTFEITGVTVDDQVGNNYLMTVQYDYNVPIRLIVMNTIFSARGPDSPIFIRDGVEFSFEGCLFHFPGSEYPLTWGSWGGPTIRGPHVREARIREQGRLPPEGWEPRCGLGRGGQPERGPRWSEKTLWFRLRHRSVRARSSEAI
ncbi:MAG: hypothetical protein BA066_06455, partial [Candidatus Korarchaeota archaeon NZ13-K]